MSKLSLYSYFRSSASFRVRIALNFKGLDYDSVPVHLLRDGGEQLKSDYRSINPDGLVPALVVGEADRAQVLTQSIAIIEYLDEFYPSPPLLPGAPGDRAFVRSVALQVACEIHPVNNLRVLNYLKAVLNVTDSQRSNWYAHWIQSGFASLERSLSNDPRVGDFVFGDTPGLADVCLIPQVWNARRFEISLDAYPIVRRIFDHAMSLPAFVNAGPAVQPDAD